jgi:PilZ domain
MDDRRKAPRTVLGVPVKVTGHEPDGTPWEELATTVDTSTSGVSFPSTHSVKKGQILHLTLALPTGFRDFDFHEPDYRVYTLVRDTTLPDNGYPAFRVGVMFFGKMPPRGYDKNPGACFLLPWDKPAEGAESPRPRPSAPARPEFRPAPGDRRRHERLDLFVNLTLQQEDEFGMVLQEELTVTENIGKGGARVMTLHGYNKGDVIVVQEIGGSFATRAEVRDVVCSGPVRRLFLKFIDRETPDHLLKI